MFSCLSALMCWSVLALLFISFPTEEFWSNLTSNFQTQITSVFDPQSNHHLPFHPTHPPVSRLYRSCPVPYLLHSESCFATSSNHHLLTFHELFSLFHKNYILCFQMFSHYCKTFVMFYKCLRFSCGCFIPKVIALKMLPCSYWWSWIGMWV